MALPPWVMVEGSLDQDWAEEGDQGAFSGADYFPAGGVVFPQLIIEPFQKSLGILAGFFQVLPEDRFFPSFDPFHPFPSRCPFPSRSLPLCISCSTFVIGDLLNRSCLSRVAIDSTRSLFF